MADETTYTNVQANAEEPLTLERLEELLATLPDDSRLPRSFAVGDEGTRVWLHGVIDAAPKPKDLPEIFQANFPVEINASLPPGWVIAKNREGKVLHAFLKRSDGTLLELELNQVRFDPMQEWQDG
jgi:hypothetical protein